MTETLNDVMLRLPKIKHSRAREIKNNHVCDNAPIHESRLPDTFTLILYRAGLSVELSLPGGTPSDRLSPLEMEPASLTGAAATLQAIPGEMPLEHAS